ncbi:MAG: UbiA family prenyltransferase [Jatrophihabitantaceae bacterium]
MRIRVLELAKACHPQPTVAVTALTTVLFASAGNTALACLVAALAIGTGQLSIGWSNDLTDRGRDVAAHRSDKPLATGRLTAPDLRIACLAALGLTVPLSLALGWLPGLVHLSAVAAGWLYNYRLKFNRLSVLAYLYAFGSLPIIATTALGHPHLPPYLIVLAAALIGSAAHYANVLPDIADDLAAGVRGLPQRAGLHGATAAACSASFLGTLCVLLSQPGWLTAAGLVAVVGVVALAARAAARDRPAVVFNAIIGCAAINVALIVATDALR